MILFKYIFIIFGILLCCNLFADANPIYKQILGNNANIDKEYAYKLSNKIHKYTKKHKIDAKIFTAILAQESMYNLQAKQCQSGLIIIDEEVSIATVCMDFGISQINWKTAKLYEFDIIKLLTDLDYSIEAGAIILRDIKKMYEDTEPETYWTRYNSSTKEKRLEYYHLVKRWL